MDYRILGPIDVVGDGGAIDIGPKQQRSLLALLLLNANRVVSTERILEEIWHDDTDGKENTLWVYVSRLRSALEPDRPARTKSTVLITKDHGYSLLVDDSSVDAHRFEADIAKARSILKDDPETAASLLRDALTLWRGEALEDLRYTDFAQSEIRRLEELRHTAIEDGFDAELRSAHHRDASADIAAFAAQHPLRERPIELLMLALYRSGRQAEALRAFEQYRRRIGSELGIEPTPELRRLEEQVLLQDSRLDLRVRTAAIEPVAASRNPFKGLQPFFETDAAMFFGRDRLISDLIRRLNNGPPLLTLVGASGSGKSSVVAAGLIPAIRKGAIEGSQDWLVARMVPGSRPFTELEAALLRSSLDAPDTLDLDDESGLLRAALRLLPDEHGRIVLVIDQFEELFTLVEAENVRRRFLRTLEVAAADPHERIVIVLALRADFYARPLEYPHFAELLGAGVVNVVNLTPDELEAAAEQPAAMVGVELEPALLVQLLKDVAGQSGGLPLFQFALTELYERRTGGMLTANAYAAMGGTRAALSRRAEQLFQTLDDEEQEAARQLFLRLVTISDTGAWSRRRVFASEVVALSVDVVALQRVLDVFGSHRLLTFDRDQAGSPTVEVAHEALLHGWERLQKRIDEGRDDVQRHAQLVAALTEWRNAGEKPDYLLTGERLDDYEAWSQHSILRLGADEQRFLDTSIARRTQEQEREAERAARESKLDRQARRRLWGMAAAVLALLLVGGGILLTVFADDAPRIAVVHGAGGDLGMDDLLVEGIAAADREFDVELSQVTPLVDPEADLRHVAETGADLIIVSGDYDLIVDEVAAAFPEVWFVAIDAFGVHGQLDNVAEIEFAVEDSAFLAGAAAAHTTRTGTVGFIGGAQLPGVEASRAGFEEGVAQIDAGIEVLSRYLGPIENPLLNADAQPDLAAALAADLYAAGADVIFQVAGASGSGVLEAARSMSASDLHLWVIGSDIDEYRTASPTHRQHILTSATKRYDTAVTSSIAAFIDGTLQSGETVLGLTENGVGISHTGDHLGRTAGQLANLEGEISFDHLSIPALPTTSPGWQESADRTMTLEMDDAGCRVIDGDRPAINGTMDVPPGEVVAFEYVNRSDRIAGLSLRTVPPGTSRSDLVEQAKTGIPASYEAVLAGSHTGPGGTTGVAMLMTQTPVVPNCYFFDQNAPSISSDVPLMILVPAA